ncbi:hypothetical protein, partial [Rhizobium leguminosarum]|uniref:hypothetical protein n=1 Tax=Rhizobium leguminosarum TaxID=384 RepID=UPI003F9AA318
LYRSNLLGADKRITNYGGGNTSAKVMETDPLAGGKVKVLWVKGSGGDVGTIEQLARLIEARRISIIPPVFQKPEVRRHVIRP